jgi:hypothetical protein
LSLRLSVLFLLRAEERNQSVLLFQEPPRTARDKPSAPFPHENGSGKQLGAQSQGIGLSGVADPALDAGIEVLPIHGALPVSVGEAAQAACKAVAVVVAQQAISRKYPVAALVIIPSKTMCVSWL